jgi:DNA-binding transcriptional LysR family regulator
MWESVELREIRVLLVLSEELHFGRTAERLGLTQSRVSQSVRELEAKLGSRLVHRTSRRVELTALGERFVPEARAAYNQLSGVLERAYDANHRMEGVLRLGLLSPPSGGGHLIEIIEAFEDRHRECRVEVKELPWTDALEPLRRGEIDLLATRLPLRQPDIVVGPVLSREPRVLAVSRSHPLAGLAEVSFERLADYEVAALDALPGSPPELVEELIPRTTPSGRPIPRAREIPRTPSELALLIARGRIVHPTTPAFAEHWGHPNLVYVPIPDMPPTRSGLAWSRRNGDPKVREFVRAARDILEASAVA